MPREEWRAAPGWSAYEVSSRGRVRSVDRVSAGGYPVTGVLLKQAPDKDGYRHVTLVNGPDRWRVHVARLVLFAFVGWPEQPGAEACHWNGRRWDNRLANLRWDDRPANRADRERHRRERRAREAATDATAPCPVKGLMPQEGSGR